MKKIRLSKTNRINFATFGAVILAYAVFQFMSGAGMLSSTIRGQLVPICAYVTMALSLNLTVGVLGELRRRCPLIPIRSVWRRPWSSPLWPPLPRGPWWASRYCGSTATTWPS